MSQLKEEQDLEHKEKIQVLDKIQDFSKPKKPKIAPKTKKKDWVDKSKITEVNHLNDNELNGYLRCELENQYPNLNSI